MLESRQRWRARLRLGAVLVGAAIVLGAVSAGQLVFNAMARGSDWTLSHALIMQTPYWLVWAALFPLVVFLVRRLSLPRTRWWSWLLYPVGALGLSLLHYFLLLLFMGVIGHASWTLPGHTFGAHFIPDMRFHLMPSLGGFVIVLFVVLALEYYRKYRERELVASQLSAQLSQARLQALRMQLNPHFLFNAMNSIAMLVRRNANGEAVRMLAGLSDLLRHVLEDAPADEVPLRAELQFLERYLEIERVRFQDRLRVRTDIEEAALDAFIPNLLLQPLVENALRHGLAAKVSPGVIEIAARRLGDRLILQVRDDGPGLAAGHAGAGTGVGLGNTRRRLEQMYGAEQSFELRTGPAGGASATVSLPWHTQPLQAAGRSAA